MTPFTLTASPHWHRMGALVSLTVAAAVIIYTDVRCPCCDRKLMEIPGVSALRVRGLLHAADRSGRGPVVSCGRCGTLCEITKFAA